jgi:hypothetical protein
LNHFHTFRRWYDSKHKIITHSQTKSHMRNTLTALFTKCTSASQVPLEVNFAPIASPKLVKRMWLAPTARMA